MSGTHLPQMWRERLLHLLLAPLETESLRFLDAWQRAEGGSADWNPLNTTFPMPWADSYNTVGVRNYGTPIEGISATASTFARDRLTGSHYLNLWRDLQAGIYSAEQLVDRNRDALKHWGTSPDLIRKILSQ